MGDTMAIWWRYYGDVIVDLDLRNEFGIQAKCGWMGVQSDILWYNIWYKIWYIVGYVIVYIIRLMLDTWSDTVLDGASQSESGLWAICFTGAQPTYVLSTINSYSSLSGMHIQEKVSCFFFEGFSQQHMRIKPKHRGLTVFSCLGWSSKLHMVSHWVRRAWCMVLGCFGQPWVYHTIHIKPVRFIV